MGITLRELMQDEYFAERMCLIAGRGGLNNSVMWFYIASDTAFGGVMPGGGELLFVNNSFSGLPVIKQIDYIDECLRRRVPGMVIIGGVDDSEKTGLIMNYAEEISFPVLSVDNPMEVVGITKQLAAALMHDEDKDGRVRSFMRELMNDNDMPLSQVLRRGLSCDINLRYPFFFISLGCEREKGTDEEILGNIIRFRDNLGYIFSELDRICTAHGAKMLSYGGDWQALCLVGLGTAEPQRRYEDISAGIDAFLRGYDSGGGIKVVAGLSEPCMNAERVKQYCRQSERALEFVSKSELDSVCVSFKGLGMMRFIGYLSESEKYELIEQAKSMIKPLADADRNNSADYVRTYRTYLSGRGTLKEIADSLYIHRNTLLKRLEQIEKLLGKDIHDPFVKNEGMNMFFVLDYFGITNNEGRRHDEP